MTNLETRRETTANPSHNVVSADDEASLVVQAQNGSPVAIEHLVARYKARLFRLSCNITGNYADAEEVVQNAFIKALRNLPYFRRDSRFYTWLVRIAVNESLMKIRTRRRTEMPIDDMADHDSGCAPELQDWGPDPEKQYTQSELRGILASAIGKLNPTYRAVFELRDIEGLTTHETAQTLDLSMAAVKTRLQRARLRLRDLLDVYFRQANGTNKSVHLRPNSKSMGLV